MSVISRDISREKEKQEEITLRIHSSLLFIPRK
jgi:hypothetical protein